MKSRAPFPLQPHHTMATPHQAAEGVIINDPGQLNALRRYLRDDARPFQVLGGGSNLFFTEDFPGIVVLNRIESHRVLKDSNGETILELGAGLAWPAVVERVLADRLYGIENLALIPGRVGAAPIQNIGAYGIEISERLVHVRAYDLDTGEWLTFPAEACGLGYRDSIFKHPPWKGRLIITHAALRLHRRPQPVIRYQALRTYFSERNITHPTPEQVFRAVVDIRTAKLPDPACLPNAGSFFKNPVVPLAQWEALRERRPDIAGWPVEGGMKLAAGWLIEQAGWKGRRIGGVGTHQRQALVIINYERRPGREVAAFAEKVRAAVARRFGVMLEAEVEQVAPPYPRLRPSN